MKELLGKAINKGDSTATPLKRLLIRFIGLVSLLIIFTIIVTVYCSRKDSLEELSMEYSVSVDNSKNSSFFLLVPMLNIPHDITEENGLNNISTQQTEYGEAYNISISGPMAFKAQGHEKIHAYYREGMPSEYLGFSLIDNYSVENLSVWDYNHDFWIYSSHTSNLSVTFEITLNYSDTWGNNIQLIFTGNVSQGWNLLSPQRDCWTWDRFSECSDRLPLINFSVVIISLIYLAYLSNRYRNECIQ